MPKGGEMPKEGEMPKQAFNPTHLPSSPSSSLPLLSSPCPIFTAVSGSGPRASRSQLCPMGAQQLPFTLFHHKLVLQAFPPPQGYLL